MSDKSLSPAAALLRGQTETRAEYIYYLVKAMKDAGVDYKRIARTGLTELGVLRGERMCRGQKLERVEDVTLTTPPPVWEAFDMTAETDGEDMILHTGYCPLYSGWKKLGLPEETCREMCEIVMSGDMQQYASAKGVSCEWRESLAHGDRECVFIFRKIDGEEPAIDPGAECRPTAHSE